MITGEVCGIADGAIEGWVEAAGARAVRLQVRAEGEAPFEVLAVAEGAEPRIRFRAAVPTRFRDGRIRFFEVWPDGADRPLAGGPAIHDGGLLDQQVPELEPPATGKVRLVQGSRLEGWAARPLDPQACVVVEVWLGDEVVASAAADQPGVSEVAGDHRFTIELKGVLRRGPHHIRVHASGCAEPLPGGLLKLGPFPADGEVPAGGYLEDEAALKALAAAPFEHLWRDAGRMSARRVLPRLVNRLRRERLAAAGREDRVLLLHLGEDAAETPSRTLWALQSHPVIAIHVMSKDLPAAREAAAGAAFVFFSRPDDLLHPSAAHIALASGCDALVWPRYCAGKALAGAPGVLLRRPPFDPATWRHGAVSDTTLAVRGAILAETPDEALLALAKGRMHPLMFWLAGRDLRWRTLPEALTASVGPEPQLSRRELERDVRFYERLLIEEGEAFTAVATAPEHPVPFVLLPARRARKVSALVCFRDRADLTLRCLQSLSRQRITGELEVVLVDNQSQPQEARRVLAGARALLGAERVKALGYDAPFNHSAQNNLAAAAADGDVLLICNNDVVIDDPAAVEQLAAWALHEGVGAVGCRLDNPGRPTGSYGHVFTAVDDDPFRPPLQEQSDPFYSRLIHACPGVSLALGAISRDLFVRTGGLDETGFPIGYNDMDLMLRLSGLGMTHLYLGHVAATHHRGASRSGDNENLQVLEIRRRHGAQLMSRWTQLSREELTSAPEAAAAAPPAQTPAGDPAALVEARRRLEQARGELVEAVLAAARTSEGPARALQAAETAILDE